MRFDVTVNVRQREGIADPEGATIERALPALGFEAVSDVRVGKQIRLVIDARDAAAARAQAETMVETFLTNPVIEDADIEVLTGDA